MADRNALNRATDSTDSPTPGYLYNDIAKSVSSSPSVCTETAQFLLRRLSSKQNHNVKYKCLKVIQMVAQSPMTRGQFKRTIIQDVVGIGAIKECLNFRGPPDPVHGDQIYTKVRTQAKETLDAIYSDDPTSGGGSMTGMTGFGSGTYGGGGGGAHAAGGGGNMPMRGVGGGGGGGGGGGMGGRKMEGIGNPMFKDPRLDQAQSVGEMTVGDMVTAAKQGFKGMIRDPLARGNSNSHNRHKIQQWNNPPGASQLSHATNGQWTMASNRGPNAITNNPSSYRPQPQQPPTSTSNYAGTGVGGSWASTPAPQLQHNPPHQHSHNHSSPSRSLPPSGNTVNITGTTGRAASDGTYERNMISELCPPGGMKAEPPVDKLRTFRQAIPSLNPDLICPALLDALEDGQPWIIRAKALCVMEASIVAAEEQSSSSGGNNAYADFFHACRQEIEPLATHSRVAVRDPARRVLKALGLEVPKGNVVLAGKTGVGDSGVAAVAPRVAQVVSPPNLLDFDDDSPPPPPSGMPPPPPPPPEEAPLAPPQGIPAKPEGVGGGGGSLFGGMNVKSNNVEKAAAPSVTQPVTDVGETDLLGGTPSLPPPAPAPAPGLFEDVTITQTVVAPVSPVDATEANKENTSLEPMVEDQPVNGGGASSSGFSFIAGTGGGNTDTHKNTTNTSGGSPTKSTFDPLLSPETRNIDPNNMANIQQQLQTPISPAHVNPQMAAAYQQQILMMQMQMQQMQMAAGTGAAPFMMMPQGGGGAVSGGGGGTPKQFNIMGGGNKVMGATTGSGVATSFAFMDDPKKVKQDASNKKFDFVQDAMKGAK